MSYFIFYINNINRNNLYFAYLGCAITYTVYHTYNDCNKLLSRYRIKNDEHIFKDKKLENDWQVCKFGAYMNFGENFFYSSVWPLTMILDFIPNIVLYLNPPKKN